MSAPRPPGGSSPDPGRSAFFLSSGPAVRAGRSLIRRTLMSFHGILDLSGKTSFVRTGYRPVPDDIALPLSVVRKHKLRPGDEITGAGEEITSVNGADPAEPRPHFADLVPLHPDRRLLLETTPTRLLPRVIDLVTPLGKGQRALVVSPPKAGKTTVLREIGHGSAVNHPECRLMVLLADERPEEVTDLRRTLRGEVIASTIDRPPAEHVAVAELAVERAKRLVERGEDVVLLLDSLTRLGRAYNLSARASGRTLSGGVDAAALLPMMRILGAARNVEGGGSLTFIASALVETGSLADTVFFEELKSTGAAGWIAFAWRVKIVFRPAGVRSAGPRDLGLLVRFGHGRSPVIEAAGAEWRAGRKPVPARDSGWRR